MLAWKTIGVLQELFMQLLMCDVQGGHTECLRYTLVAYWRALPRWISGAAHGMRRRGNLSV